METRLVEIGGGAGTPTKRARRDQAVSRAIEDYRILGTKRLSYQGVRWHVRTVPVRIPSAAFDLAPVGTTIVRAERMSPAFIKYHLDDGRALHRFVRPEPHVHPHDHPWSFETTILSGGYVEEVFTFLPDGSWQSALVERAPGSRHRIEAHHIHRIVSLPGGESWTIVQAGSHERKTLFWRFGDTVQRRAWNVRSWRDYRPPIIPINRQPRFDDAR